MAQTQDSLKACIDNEITVCSICLQTFDNPRSLPCLHTYCQRCIEEYCNSNTFTWNRISCPQCRREFTLPPGGVSNLPHNFVMENLILVSRNHQYCAEHDEEILKKFCTKCRLKICSVCEVTHHGNHSIIRLSDAHKHLVKCIDEEVAKVTAVADRISEEKERLDEMTDDFMDKTDQIVDDIKSTGKEMKRVIDERVDMLISEVKAVENETLDKLKSMTKPLKWGLRKVEQLNDDACDAKSHEKIEDVVGDYEKLCDTARQFLECEVSPSPYMPPEISFVADPNNSKFFRDFHLGEIVVHKCAAKRKRAAAASAVDVASAKRASNRPI